MCRRPRAVEERAQIGAQYTDQWRYFNYLIDPIYSLRGQTDLKTDKITIVLNGLRGPKTVHRYGRCVTIVNRKSVCVCVCVRKTRPGTGSGTYSRQLIVRHIIIPTKVTRHVAFPTDVCTRPVDFPTGCPASLAFCRPQV